MKLQPPKRLEVSDDAIGWSVHVDDGVHVVSEVEIWPEDVKVSILPTVISSSHVG
jgi:hypothetical protein